MSWAQQSNGNLVSQNWGGQGRGVFQPTIVSGAGAGKQMGFYNDPAWQAAAAQQQRQPAAGAGGGAAAAAHPSNPLSNPLYRWASGMIAQNVPRVDVGQPNIDTSPVWNAQQMAKQSNDIRSLGQQATDTDVRNFDQSVGGKGFGSRSPFAMQMEQMLGQSGRQRTDANALQFEMGAAEKNRNARFQAQNALEEALRGRKGLEVSQRNKDVDTRNANIEAIMSMGRYA